MNWILEHLQIVVALAAAFAYWLKQTKDKAEAEKDRNVPPPLVTPAADEQTERTRRIQEEIRRKIADRREGAAVPSSPPMMTSERPAVSSTRAPRPIAEPMGGTLRKRLEAKMAAAMARIEEAAKAAAEREEERRQPARQQEIEAEAARETERLAAQRRAAVETLAEREERIAFAPPESLAQERQATATIARSVRDELRDPDSVRRAWILREVLGPPLGLR
jgi:hypothetical protein